jgi:hypothetical protein
MRELRSSNEYYTDGETGYKGEVRPSSLHLIRIMGGAERGQEKSRFAATFGGFSVF